MMTKTLAANTQNVLPSAPSTTAKRMISSDSVSVANSNNSVASSNSGSGSERDLFMTLLVTQLKNQDPLQPQDGAAFVAQLAQFNSLDQLVGIRQSIEQLTVQMQQSQQDSTNQEII